MLNVTLESLSDMIFRGTIENVILDPNNYLNWLRLASQFGGPSSTISRLPFFCYEKAVELSGSAETPCYHLAECYENGVCCPKNLGKALEYYTLAAKNDNPTYLKKLADCYRDGVGTSVDNDKATELYNKAEAIIKEEESKRQVKIKESQKVSFESYTKKIKNNIDHWISLGDCYKEGRGTKKKYSKAYGCYKVVFDFYNNTKDYDKKYGIVLKRLKECFEHGQGTEEEKKQILEAIKDYEGGSKSLSN